MRSTLLLCGFAALLLLPSSAAAETELLLEGGAELVVDSNPLRVSQGPTLAAGALERSRAWFELREKWLLIGVGGGFESLQYPSLRATGPGGPVGFDRLTEWHLGLRVVPGWGSFIEVEVAPTMGARATPEDGWDEPDDEPGDLLALPRRRDRHPDASPATYDLRGAIPARFTFLPMRDLRVTLHGGGRWLLYSAAGTMLSPSPIVLLRRFDGGGGARIEWSALPQVGVQVDLGLSRTIELERPLGGDEGVLTRAGAVGGVVLRHLDVVRVDLRIGWLAGHDSRAGWLLAPGGLVGLGRVQLAPDPALRIEAGVGRDVRLPLGLLGTETSAWVRVDANVVDRVEPWGGFQWAYRDVLTLPSVNGHRWTAGTGVRLRAWGGLWFAAGFRWSMLNPSSTNSGEYISARAHVGLHIRAYEGPAMGDRWGGGEPMLPTAPP